MKVLIFGGWFGSKNLGDDAILIGIRKMFENLFPESKIIAQSIDPNYTSLTCGVEAINLYSPLEIFRNPQKIKFCSDFDLIIISGGTPFYDYDHLNRLIHMGLPILYKKKIFCFGIGTKKIESFKGKFLICNLLNRFERISVRDKKSKELLENISKRDIKLTGDSALLIDPPEEDFVKNVLKKASLNIKIPYIIISPRILSNKNKLFYHDHLEDSKINEIRYYIAKTADKILESGVNVVFLPMQKKYNDDRYEIIEIINLMKNKAVTIFEPSNPYEAMAAIRPSRMVIGLRLHSLILSTLCGVPAFSIPYDEKILGFMESINNVEGLAKPQELPLKAYVSLNENYNLKQIRDSCKNIRSRILNEGKKIAESLQKIY